MICAKCIIWLSELPNQPCSRRVLLVALVKQPGRRDAMRMTHMPAAGRPSRACKTFNHTKRPPLRPAVHLQRQQQQQQQPKQQQKQKQQNQKQKKQQRRRRRQRQHETTATVIKEGFVWWRGALPTPWQPAAIFSERKVLQNCFSAFRGCQEPPDSDKCSLQQLSLKASGQEELHPNCKRARDHSTFLLGPQHTGLTPRP